MLQHILPVVGYPIKKEKCPGRLWPWPRFFWRIHRTSFIFITGHDWVMNDGGQGAPKLLYFNIWVISQCQCITFVSLHSISPKPLCSQRRLTEEPSRRKGQGLSNDNPKRQSWYRGQPEFIKILHREPHTCHYTWQIKRWESRGK